MPSAAPATTVETTRSASGTWLDQGLTSSHAQLVTQVLSASARAGVRATTVTSCAPSSLAAISAARRCSRAEDGDLRQRCPCPTAQIKPPRRCCRPNVRRLQDERVAGAGQLGQLVHLAQLQDRDL